VHPLRDVMSPALVRLLADAPLSPGKVRFAWKLAVGPAVDRVTTATFRDNCHVGISVPDERWRAEVRRALPFIRRRLDALLGAEAVARITIRVTRPGTPERGQ